MNLTELIFNIWYLLHNVLHYQNLLHIILHYKLFKGQQDFSRNALAQILAKEHNSSLCMAIVL